MPPPVLRTELLKEVVVVAGLEGREQLATKDWPSRDVPPKQLAPAYDQKEQREKAF
jgi:hypothetical protein